MRRQEGFCCGALPSMLIILLIGFSLLCGTWYDSPYVGSMSYLLVIATYVYIPCSDFLMLFTFSIMPEFSYENTSGKIFSCNRNFILIYVFPCYIFSFPWWGGVFGVTLFRLRLRGQY